MKKIYSVIALVLLILLIPVYSLADSKNLSVNGDFEEPSTTSYPRGWSFSTWDENSPSIAEVVEIEGRGNVVYIKNEKANDTSLYQVMPVEPNSYYEISCYIKTAGVESGKGANISVLHSHAYSTSLFGDNDWQKVSFIGQTNADQEEISVAIRIGGYSGIASGEAWFDDVTVTKLDKAPSDTSIVQKLYIESQPNPNNTEGENMPYMGTILGLTLLFAIALILIYNKVIKNPKMIKLNEKKGLLENPYMIFILLGLGLVIRILCNYLFQSVGDDPQFGHPTDIKCFFAWGERMLSNGPSGFYAPDYFCDYPPGYLYFLGLSSGLSHLFGAAYGSATHALFMKLPSIIADLLFAFLAYKTAKRIKLNETVANIAACFVLFNPTIIFLSSVWGQIDIILSLLIAIAAILFIDGTKIVKTAGLLNPRIIACGAIYGLAILIKPQALMVGPVFFVAYIVYIINNDKRNQLNQALLNTVLAVLSAFAVILLVSFPFKPQLFGQEGLVKWLFEKYIGTVGGYNYASVEAYNFMSLIGGLWTNADKVVFLGLTYKHIGTILMVFVGIATAVYYVFGEKKNKSALILCMAFMFAGLFTFGHYMHERYIFPTLVLLVLAAVAYKDKRLYLLSGLYSISAFLNSAGAFIIISNQFARTESYDNFVLLGSLFTVLCFLYFIYVGYKIMINGKIEKAFDAKKPEQLAITQTTSGRILPDKVDNKLRFKRKDYIFIIAVTLIYAVIALTNLGTTQAPENGLVMTIQDEDAVIEFDKKVEISSVYVYGGIANQSRVALRDADNNVIASYEQVYGHMFRWREITTTPFSTNKVVLSVESGKIDFKEIAFYDPQGNPIIGRSNEFASPLIDEPDEIPIKSKISYMNGMYFDELYHGRTAYEHLHNLKAYEVTHPPLGKIIISIGIAIFGMNAFGWRVMGALFGVAMVPIIYCFAKRLFKKSEYALLVAFIFAFDFMHYVQTRIATIDVYGVFFILLMFYYMYQYFTMNVFVDGLKATFKPLALAGLFFGLGAASKWICFYAGGGLAIMFLISIIQRIIEYKKVMAYGTPEEEEKVSHFPRYLIATIGWCLIFFVALPIVIYSASYLVFPDVAQAFKQKGIQGFMDRVWYWQKYMYDYHSDLKATHSFQSPWYSWLLDIRPIWFYKGAAPDGYVATISSFGNPYIWIPSLIGTIALVVLTLKKKLKANAGIIMVIIGVASNLGPWVLVTRCTFIYHYFATVPFIILGAVYLLKYLEEKYNWLSYIKWGWMIVAGVMFAAYYPFLTGIIASKKYMELLQWMPSWTFLGLQGPIKGPIFGICVTVFIIIAFVLFGMMKKQKYEARFL